MDASHSSIDFELHPSRPVTSVPTDDKGEVLVVSSPFSQRPLNDCYQEQVSGSLSLIPRDTDSQGWQAIIPIALGTWSVTFELSHDRPRPSYEVLWTEQILQIEQNRVGIRYYAKTWYQYIGTSIVNGGAAYWSSWYYFANANAYDWADFGPVPRCPIQEAQLLTRRSYVESLFDSQRDAYYSGPFHWGKLCQRAATSIRSLDINGIAYLKDATELLKEVAHFISHGPIISGGEIFNQLGEKITTKRQAARQSASTFLGYHYGTRLMARDTAEIDKALDRLKSKAKDLFQRASASETISVDTVPGFQNTAPVVWTRRVNATVRSFSDKLLHTVESMQASIDQLKSRILRAGYEYDLLPTASNIWDLVPFSFVVDWFLPIGSNLQTMEDIRYMSTLPLQCIFYTDEMQFDAAFSWHNSIWQTTGALHHKIYVRKCSRSFVLPDIVDSKPDSAAWPRHIVEATALLTNLFA